MAWDDGDVDSSEGRNEDVEIECKVLRATDMALLCEVDGAQHWIPKSQIRDNSDVAEVDDEGTLVIPRWLAEDKGLV